MPQKNVKTQASCPNEDETNIQKSSHFSQVSEESKTHPLNEQQKLTLGENQSQS